MNHIEILNVEYGDCTVFAGKNGGCFFIDCGSSNNRLRNPPVEISDVFSFIQKRYEACSFRHFLLTHYHKDHIRGFKKIISESPGYFSRIYLPFIPFEEDTLQSPVLDFAVMTSGILPYQTACRHVNLSCLCIFDLLKNDLENVYILSSGDTFQFDGDTYEVLSPAGEGFRYNPRLIKIVSAMESCCSEEFLAAKLQFTDLYYRCLKAFSVKTRGSRELRLHLAEQLSCAFSSLNEIPPCNGDSMDKLAETAASMDAMELYSEAINMLSIVFHNKRQAGNSGFDILMTGDAPEKLAACFEHRLYGEYNIVKAPHHGTESYYWEIFSHMGINHMIISNGEYSPGGNISPRYAQGEYICHCTNKACDCADTGQCCSNLKFCYDAGTLALKCKLIDRLGKPCKIYVVSPTGSRGCL